MPTDLTDRTPAEFLAAAIAVTTAAGANHRNGDEIDGSDAYSSCRYVHDGRPSCYAARVLHQLGVPVGDLLANEGWLVDWGMFSVPVPVTVRRQLGQAQEMADSKEPWGDVTAMLLEELESAIDVTFPDDLRAQVRELEAQVTTNA